jgi:hypothetical protein
MIRGGSDAESVWQPERLWEANIRHNVLGCPLVRNMPPRPLSTTYAFDRPLSPIVQRSLTILSEDVSNDRVQLTPAEEAWSAHQDYLESNGFILRPRLRRGWKPSWLGTSDNPSKYEDSIRITVRSSLLNGS